MSNTKKPPHSSEYFGPQRDFWWNTDFLQLMSKRWEMQKVKKFLDAGCGIGHWGRSLAKFLPRDAAIYGIDKEPVSIETAKKLATKSIQQTCLYQTGDVYQLPFEDNFFDMVTCQTLLIHIDDVKIVMREFIRVAKPGGLIALVEPNNLVQTLILNSTSFNLSFEDKIDLVKFQLICERGKALLKEGNNSIGDRIPSYLNEIGADNIQVYLSDKTSFLLPPYESEEQQVISHELIDWDKNHFWTSEKEKNERYFKAGTIESNDSKAFDYYWEKIALLQTKTLQEIQEKQFSSSGASLMYLVSGKKR